MKNGGELVYHLPYHLLVDIDRSTRKTHVPSKGEIFESAW